MTSIARCFVRALRKLKECIKVAVRLINLQTIVGHLCKIIRTTRVKEKQNLPKLNRIHYFCNITYYISKETLNKKQYTCSTFDNNGSYNHDIYPKPLMHIKLGQSKIHAMLNLIFAQDNFSLRQYRR